MRYLSKMLAFVKGQGDFPRRYTAFRPVNGKMLIRYFQRPPVISDGEMTLENIGPSDYATLTRQAATGQRFDVKPVKTEFMFAPMAVVVAVDEGAPDRATKYRPGQIVAVRAPVVQALRVDAQLYISYVDAFIHPASGRVGIPMDSDDDDYGYAIVNEYDIYGIIDPEDIGADA
ncbi:MAG: hypothetical protein KatS3mg054_0045 [Chloroflexus sp.]|nr:MAG: hypothetical protein KatS3mg054_0045 [Chloroflexus sp.]